jgi:hypothetical protein
MYECMYCNEEKLKKSGHQTFNVVADSISLPPSCASPATALLPVFPAKLPMPPESPATSAPKDSSVVNSAPPLPPTAAPPPDHLCQQIEYAAIITAQPACPDVTLMCHSTSSRPHHEQELFSNISSRVFCPLLPPKFRQMFIAALATSITPVSGPLSAWFQLPFAGQDYARMSPLSPEPVWVVKAA